MIPLSKSRKSANLSMIGGFSRPSAVGITPIAPDASARAQNEEHHNQKAWAVSHRPNLTTEP